MSFTIGLGILRIIYSALTIGDFPFATDLLSAFILGALIDLYILIKKRNT